MEKIEEWLLSQPKIITRAGVCPFISAKGSIALAELRTHLFNYMVARYVTLKGGKGIFILRCDDTDISNTDIKYMSSIVSMFNDILEAKPDLHPYHSEHVLDYPLIQSKRTALYECYMTQLLNSGLVYQENNQFPLVFSVKKYIECYGAILEAFDFILGKMSFDLLQEQRIHDFPITRSDGSALWHFCSVVDDFDAGVNLVIRAQDKVGNVPYQEMIRFALGFPTKKYLHLPLMLQDKTMMVPLNFLSTVHEMMRYGISSRAIVIYLFTSLFKNNDALHFELDDLISKVDFSYLITSSNRFDFNRVLYVNKIFNARSTDRDYLNELNKSALIVEDADWLQSLTNQARQLLVDLRFDYFQSKQTIKSLIDPVYFNMPNFKLNSILNVFVALFVHFEKISGYGSVFGLMKRMIADDQSIIPILRWMLTGNSEGISIYKVVDFLESTNTSLLPRFIKIKQFLETV